MLDKGVNMLCKENMVQRAEDMAQDMVKSFPKPEEVMKVAISGEEFKDLYIFD